jgi:hypothetical protein
LLSLTSEQLHGNGNGNRTGQRIRKTQGTAATTSLFWYDPQSGQLMGEYDSAGKPVVEFV